MDDVGHGWLETGRLEGFSYLNVVLTASEMTPRKQNAPKESRLTEDKPTTEQVCELSERLKRNGTPAPEN